MIIGLGFGGWYALREDKVIHSPNNASKSNPDDSTEPTDSKLPENWSEFKNDEFGFRFGYPTDFGDLEKSEVGSNVLLNLSTANKKDPSQNLQGPLGLMILTKENPVINTVKYGPLIKAVYSNEKISFWQVSTVGSRDLYAQYHEGDNYPIKSQKVRGGTAYDFSYSDEECTTSRWILNLKTAWQRLRCPACVLTN